MGLGSHFMIGLIFVFLFLSQNFSSLLNFTTHNVDGGRYELMVHSGRGKNTMNPISLIWKTMSSVASHFNTKVFYPSIFPIRFICIIGVVALCRVKVQTKGSVGRMHFGLKSWIYIIQDVLYFDPWIIPESSILKFISKI